MDVEIGSGPETFGWYPILFVGLWTPGGELFLAFVRSNPLIGKLDGDAVGTELRDIEIGGCVTIGAADEDDEDED